MVNYVTFKILIVVVTILIMIGGCIIIVIIWKQQIQPIRKKIKKIENIILRTTAKILKKIIFAIRRRILKNNVKISSL